ncbi:MAG: hypothetical protein LBJ61_05100 [Deltaproteobacteria bacterium]|jgi:hypothetical protein|nr:hypothetical protein [Deltaproteobacteria bacterium]
MARAKTRTAWDRVFEPRPAEMFLLAISIVGTINLLIKLNVYGTGNGFTKKGTAWAVPFAHFVKAIIMLGKTSRDFASRGPDGAG